MGTPITIKNLTKRFGDVVAVNKVSLEIEAGAFLTLLGPSGCGKTTLLRCIAGLDDPNEGEIYIGEKLVFSSKRGISLPPGQRDLGLVFQNYALWPHMTVYKNMTFALEIQKLSKEEMNKRVKQALAEVQMSYRPKVFLMDEPLSNLDARLRMDMRTELKRLHHISGATTVYVTHDQVEALTMSSSIAVMKLGVIQQRDTPDRVYHFPSNLFVADFIGNPKVNLLNGRVDGDSCIELGTFAIPVKAHNKRGEVVLAVRPEDITISTEPVAGGIEFSAYSILPSGADSTIIARRDGLEVTVRVMGISNIRMDEKIWLKFDTDTLNLYDKTDGNLISSPN
jgi:multiple sugar transport system ATP-binding protein